MLDVPMKLIITGILIFFLLSSTATIVEGYDRDIIEEKCRGLLNSLADRFDGMDENIQIAINIKLPAGLRHRVVAMEVPSDSLGDGRIGFHLDNGDTIWIHSGILIVDMRPDGDGKVDDGVHIFTLHHDDREFIAIVG